VPFSVSAAAGLMNVRQHASRTENMGSPADSVLFFLPKQILPAFLVRGFPTRVLGDDPGVQRGFAWGGFMVVCNAGDEGG